MTQHPGPALNRRRLALALTELRETSGLDTNAVAHALRCHRTQISHFESGRRLPRYTDLVVLLQLYDASERLDELGALLEEADQRGWWDLPELSQTTRLYLGLENDADTVRSFALELVPGLVQHPSYIRAIESRHGSSEREITSAINAREKRRSRTGSGLTANIVLSEGLLWRTLNMGQAGIDQLRYLQENADLDGITVSVLEYSSGAHRSMSSSFTVLSFSDNVVGSVGYLPHGLGAQLVDDQRVVAGLDELYLELERSARSLKTSTAMADVLEGLEDDDE